MTFVWKPLPQLFHPHAKTHLLHDPLSPTVPRGYGLYLISLNISIPELHTHPMPLPWPGTQQMPGTEQRLL